MSAVLPRGLAAALLAAAGLLAVAPGAGAQDLERGRALYENHCRVCHTQKVHTRPNRIALTRADMRRIVEAWQREENLRWSTQDIDDVVDFLGVSLYKLQ